MAPSVQFKNDENPNLTLMRTAFPIGRKFKFLGVQMAVNGYQTVAGGRFIDCLSARYVNTNGELCETKFLLPEIPALIADNPS